MQAPNLDTLTISDIKDLITYCKDHGVYELCLGDLRFSLEKTKPQFHDLPEMAPAPEMTPAQQRAVDDRLMFMSSF